MAAVKEGIVTELHRQARKRFPRRSVYIKGIDDVWQCDLVDMQQYAKENRGHKYILTVIDALSKYGWALPVRDKRGETVAAAMKSLLRPARIPTNIQCDQGREFFNSHFQALMKRYGINLYTTYSPLKASIVERFNRTLKTWMYKEFSLQGNYRWLNLLPKLLTRYNGRVHRTIGMAPKQVTASDESSLLDKLRSTKQKKEKKKKLKYSIGDTVRISKYKTLFAKGYTPNWSTELFTIDDVRLSSPPVYYLRDTRGERIKGAFYEQELQKTSYPDTYLVEKVLRRKGNKALVRWLNLDPSFDSWIENVPKRN